MLLVALLAIAVMTIQGSIATDVAVSNIKTSVAARRVVTAEDIAQGGLTETRTRLQGFSGAGNNPVFAGDPNLQNPFPQPPTALPAPNANWSAYLLTSASWTTATDPSYSGTLTNYLPTLASLTATAITANSLQSTLPYWTSMRHKREYDAEQAGHVSTGCNTWPVTGTRCHYYDNDGSIAAHTAGAPGNIIYYGYPTPSVTTPVQFTTAVGTTAGPVELITSYGYVGTTSKVLQAEAARDPGPPRIATLYSRGNVSWNAGVHNSSTIDGNDSAGTGCHVQADRAPVAVLSPWTVTPCGGAGAPSTCSVSKAPDSPTYNSTATANTTQTTTVSIDPSLYTAMYQSNATVTLMADVTKATTYGSSSNYVTVYSTGPRSISGGVTGYGLLLVDGNLTVGNNVKWYGGIIVNGTLSINGDDKTNLYGAAWASLVSSSTDKWDLFYNSCHVANALSTQPTKRIRWRYIQ